MKVEIQTSFFLVSEYSLILGFSCLSVALRKKKAKDHTHFNGDENIHKPISFKTEPFCQIGCTNTLVKANTDDTFNAQKLHQRRVFLDLLLESVI